MTTCRNWLYDIDIFKVWKFEGVKIISVGNLSVGGTGKTPMVEYLIKKGLSNNLRLAVLSRGYGRKTKGLRLVTADHTAWDVGDESFGYFVQFGNDIKVVVAESRVEGIQFIQGQFSEIQLIILDDAYQHRSVKADFSILLTTHKRPFWNDYLLPSGLLRESRRGYRRTDAIVVTKSPLNFKETISNFGGYEAIYSTVKYGEIKMKSGEWNEDAVLALAGLADNEPFFNFVRSKYNVSSTFSFRDHMKYDDQVLMDLVSRAKAEKATLLTTFKDAVKLISVESMNDVSWGYIPIEVEFLKGETELTKLLAPYYDTSLETEQ